ncbi:hypothetical protein [Streptomyces sp. NPDC093094]|uniref:hypothetical protein n=1 Tax=Streptomyces sp. NPDC093094 TaxID=3366026 RepID=UPI0038266EB1
MASRRVKRQNPAPFLELHWGGVHLVIERVPYPLLAVIGSAAGALGGAAWMGGR